MNCAFRRKASDDENKRLKKKFRSSYPSVEWNHAVQIFLELKNADNKRKSEKKN